MDTLNVPLNAASVANNKLLTVISLEPVLVFTYKTLGKVTSMLQLHRRVSMIIRSSNRRK